MRLIYELLRDGAYAPEKAYPEDAGWDVKTPKDITLMPGQSVTVPLGIAIRLEPTPEQEAYCSEHGLGWYTRVADKSGLASKFGIHTMAGVIDAGYRGEVCITVVNLGFWDGDRIRHLPWKLSAGDKIAQLIPEMLWDVSEAAPGTMDTTDRGANGFGSSGR